MSEHSNIEWTQATWNPIVGCSVHSPGCRECYAMPVAWRLMHNPNPKIAAKFAGTAKLVKGKPVFTGRVNLDEATLLAPLKRRTPTVYFVNSLSDLFHENVPDEWVDRIFAVMALCSQHTFQVLTKRAGRMRAYLEDALEGVEIARWRLGGPLPALERSWPLRNVWLGVSVEDQLAANLRIPDLIAAPAKVRFLSCEPLIGSVRLPSVAFHCDLCGGTGMLARFPKGRCHHCGGRGSIPAISTDPQFGGPSTPMRRIDWVICGGESGPRARPMHPDWARSLRDQCAAAGVPFFFKQWGAWGPYDRGRFGAGAIDEPLSKFGKKLAGRLLDGAEHNGLPA